MIQEDVDNLTNVTFLFILTARSVVITTMIIHNFSTSNTLMENPLQLLVLLLPW